MKRQVFLVKGTILDTDYDKLLEEKAKDIVGKQLKVGDKVAYSTIKRYSDRVSIGEITDVWLEYGCGAYNYNTNSHQPKLDVIYCYVKIKFEKGGHSYKNSTKSPEQVAKI